MIHQTALSQPIVSAELRHQPDIDCPLPSLREMLRGPGAHMRLGLLARSSQKWPS